MAALAGRVVFCNVFDPEIEFYTKFCKNKLAWSRKMTQEHKAKVVVIGGSSVAFSVMGKRMLEQHDLPTVNMGLEAPFGTAMLTNWALGELRRGDTLIVANEPTRLVAQHELFSSGCKISNSLGHPEWAYLPWETPVAPYLHTTLRSSIGWKRMVVVWKSYFKKNKAKPRWPYIIAETDASGWQTASKRRPFTEINVYSKHLSEDNKNLLRWTREWCDQHGVRVAYSVAWAFREPSKAADIQEINRSLLKEIAEIMPVLKDPRLGVDSERSHYVDTHYHLDTETAAVRSDELARQIKEWDVWKPGELDALP